MGVVIKSIDDLKSRLTKPPICNYVEENLEEINDNLWEVMEGIYSTDGNVILDRKCKITFLSLDVLQEYILYNELKTTINKNNDFIITDNARDRADNIVNGVKHYLDTKIGMKKVGNDEPCIIILEYDNGERDIRFGLIRYVKRFLGIN